MRYGAEHKQQTRERILKEAANAIRMEGVQKIAVAPVMAKAGLTQGGFYAHFASRDDLVAAAIDQMFLDGSERLTASLEGRAPAEGLAIYLDFYLSRAHCETRTAGCPLPFLSADAPRLEPEARARITAGVRRMTDRIAVVLQAMGRPDAETAAGSLVNEIVGAVSLARVEPDAEASDAILARSR
ncbi:MAG: TetR family transcriptional regulator, partial [Caulobacterales bacterium 68-7]